jgi:hypothetical protein
MMIIASGAASSALRASSEGVERMTAVDGLSRRAQDSYGTTVQKRLNLRNQ